MQTRPIKNIVIVGAGPIGLYLALKLNKLIKDNGLAVTLTVADSRIGKYNRPGVIAQRALGLLEQSLGTQINDVPKPVEYAMFIQDLEKSLFNRARKAGIKFHDKKFKSLDNMTIKLEDGTALPCDLVLDCTGGQGQAVIQYVNSQAKGKKAFEIKRVDDNPLKYHFVAYITMDETNATLSRQDNTDPLKKALALDKLRHEFDWEEFALPETQTGRWTDRNDKTTIHAYYYFEIPKSLAKASKEKQIAFLKTLLLARCGHEIDFTTSNNPLKFSPFVVDPHEVTPAMHHQDKTLPIIVACGDRQIAPDYRRGHGVESGIMRANVLLDALHLTSEWLKINIDAYNFEITRPTARHKELLQDTYDHRRMELLGALREAGAYYQQALEASETPEEIVKIYSGIVEMARVSFFDDIKKIHDPKLGGIQVTHIKSLEEKEKELQMMTQLLIDKLNQQSAEKEKKHCLRTLALSYKQLANGLYELGTQYLTYASKYYKKALALFDELNDHQQRARIYGNLSAVTYKQKNFAASIDFADQSLAELENIPAQVMADKEKLVVKISYRKCNAMIDILEKQKDTALIPKIQTLFEEINKNKADMQPGTFAALEMRWGEVKKTSLFIPSPKKGAS